MILTLFGVSISEMRAKAPVKTLKPTVLPRAGPKIHANNLCTQPSRPARFFVAIRRKHDIVQRVLSEKLATFFMDDLRTTATDEFSNHSLDDCLRFLRRLGTVEIVQSLLKEADLPHSIPRGKIGGTRLAGIAALIEGRIKPAINDGLITEDLVARWAHELEENGRQRTHLFQQNPKNVAHLFRDGHLENLSAKRPLAPEVGVLTIQEHGNVLKLVEIRRDRLAISERPCIDAVVFKVVQQHKHRVLVHEGRRNGRYVMEFEDRVVPTINIVRVMKTGVIEIRMQKDEAVESYRGLAESLWANLDGFITRSGSNDLYIHDFLDRIWDPKHRNRLSQRFKVTISQHENRRKTSMELRSGPAASGVAEDGEAVGTIDRFHQSTSKGQCNSAYVVAKTGVHKDEEVMVHFHGDPNAFSIHGRCRRATYDAALLTMLDEVQKNGAMNG